MFNIFLEFVLDEVKSLKEFQLDRELATDVRYADDTTLVSAIFEKLSLSTEELETALEINASKCKIMSTENDNIYINGEIVENVNSFVFLGSSVPNTTVDVKRRIALACSAFGRLKNNIWGRREVTNKLKVRLYNALILPIAIYGSESWTLKSEDSRRLLVFENDCLRCLVGKTRLDKCRMQDIRSELNVTRSILDVIKKKRLLWFGNVVRKREGSYVYRAYKQEFNGNQPRGRPSKRWSDQIRDDLKVPLLTTERNARDRDRWKRIVNVRRSVKDCSIN